MPMPKHYQTFRQAMNSPTSRLETLEEGASDPFTEASAQRDKNGLTYIQMLEIYHKDRDLYEQLLHDSAFD